MKFLTCPGATSGKNFKVMLPNFVSMIALVSDIFLISSGVNFFGCCWAKDAEATSTPIDSNMRKRAAFFIDQQPPVPEDGMECASKVKDIHFYQKAGGLSNETRGLRSSGVRILSFPFPRFSDIFFSSS